MRVGLTQLQATEYLQLLGGCLPVGRAEVHRYVIGVLSITIAIVIVTIYLHVCIYTIIVSVSVSVVIVIVIVIANWDVMVDCDVGVVDVLQHLVISG